MHNIDYVVNPAIPTLDIDQGAAEYKFYVKRRDYERVLAVIENRT